MGRTDAPHPEERFRSVTRGSKPNLLPPALQGRLHPTIKRGRHSINGITAQEYTPYSTVSQTTTKKSRAPM